MKLYRRVARCNDKRERLEAHSRSYCRFPLSVHGAETCYERAEPAFTSNPSRE